MSNLIHSAWIRNFTTALIAAAFLGACLSDESTSSSFSGPGTGTVPPVNAAPQISGTPPGTVDVGETYSFTPNASDADGDRLTFSISNPPTWTNFDASTGRLSGTPTLGDAGTETGIVISVTDGSASSSLAAFSITVSTVATNSPPTIFGSPPASVAEGQMYSFLPGASDADGDSLTFAIVGQPSWASFDMMTGQLSGTPGPGDVGVYSGIVISVSDSEASDSLPAFSVTVDSLSLGSATLSWNAPTLNEDGTTLTDLAGYKLYWGTTPGSYTNSATIDNPSVTTHVVENLSPGTYEFVATAFNSAGVESRFSGTATKTLP